MTAHDIALRCACGSVHGIYRGFSESDQVRAICLCDDCQAYAHFLGHAASILDSSGGTDIVPMRPARFEIVSGHEHVACLRLSQRGLNRFYASCCKTPIANAPGAAFPYIGVVHTFIDTKSRLLTEVVGPVRAIMQARFALGAAPKGASKTVSVSFIFRTMRYLLRGLLSGLAKPTPFFNEKGEPITKPYILTPQERQALRPLCGPQPAIRP